MIIPKPGTGILQGKQLEPRYLAELDYEAGWNDAQVLPIAVAVCLAESQGYTEAIHTNHDGSMDRGIWQLSTVHKWITDAIAFDPVKATDAAFRLYLADGSGFGDWVAYTSKTYLRDAYIGRAARGVGNYLADMMLKADAGEYVHAFETPILDFRFRLGVTQHHVGLARQTLSYGAKSAAIVLATQKELSKAQQAAKPIHP